MKQYRERLLQKFSTAEKNCKGLGIRNDTISGKSGERVLFFPFFCNLQYIYINIFVNNAMFYIF